MKKKYISPIIYGVLLSLVIDRFLCLAIYNSPIPALHENELDEAKEMILDALKYFATVLIDKNIITSADMSGHMSGPCLREILSKQNDFYHLANLTDTELEIMLSYIQIYRIEREEGKKEGL